MREVKNLEDDEAPHGRDANGVPEAPYGLKADGNPRKSNRGAKPGQRGNGGPSKSPGPVGAKATLSKTDKNRREALLGLMEGYVALPMIAASMNPFIARRIGAAQAMALAGDALIVQTYAPAAADALILASQEKPGLLRWLDTLEEKAPWLMLANVGIQIVKALVGNHAQPDPRLASAAVQMARIKAIQYAHEVEEQARAMGIPTEVLIPDENDGDQVAA